MTNLIWRTALRLAYLASRCFFFCFRPRTFGVLVAIWHSGKLLVIRNSYKPQISLPGGYLKSHENPSSAAIREIKEEIGIDIPPNRLTKAGRMFSREEFKRETVAFFEYRPQGDVIPDADQREVVWARFLTIDEILSLPCSAHLIYYLNLACKLRPSEKYY